MGVTIHDTSSINQPLVCPLQGSSIAVQVDHRHFDPTKKSQRKNQRNGDFWLSPVCSFWSFFKVFSIFISCFAWSAVSSTKSGFLCNSKFHISRSKMSLAGCSWNFRSDKKIIISSWGQISKDLWLYLSISCGTTHRINIAPWLKSGWRDCFFFRMAYVITLNHRKERTGQNAAIPFWHLLPTKMSDLMEVYVFLQRPKNNQKKMRMEQQNNSEPKSSRTSKFMSFLQALQKKRNLPQPCEWLFPIPPIIPLPLQTPSLRCNSNRLSTPLMTCNSSKGGRLELMSGSFGSVTPMNPKTLGIFWSREVTDIAHENHHRNPGKYHQNGGFSMAMLVYRSVTYTLQSLTGEMMLGKRSGFLFQGLQGNCFNHDSHDLADSIWNQDFRRFCSSFLHITYICPQPILSNWMFNPRRWE